MRSYPYLICFLIVAALILSVKADEIELLSGLVVKGKIVQETDEKVFIQTEQYGQLGFEKLKIRRIIYEGGVIPPAVVTPTLTPSVAAPVPIIKPLSTDASGQKLPPEEASLPEIAARAPTIGITPAPTPPEIMPGYDAVLFGVVKEVKVRSGGSEWKDANEGSQLKVGAEILTGEGKVKIRLRGRGELRLPPNSHLILKYISPEGNDITVEMRGGAVWNNVTPGGGLISYQVHTPDLTAGVRGTLFKIEISLELGSRIAVFEGTVETVSIKTQEKVEIEQLKEVIVDKQGQITPPKPVDPKEREEWDYWDQWALEVHSIAVRFPIGGQAIDDLARLHAEDMKRYERMMAEANERILANREENKLQELAKAFEGFYKDTGVVPTEEQGFKALVENPGIAGWKGPYYQGEVPPKDRWDSPIHYIVGRSQVSGNVYGKVISCGPDKIFSKGNPATDDIAVMVRYYTIQPLGKEQ